MTAHTHSTRAINNNASEAEAMRTRTQPLTRRRRPQRPLLPVVGHVPGNTPPNCSRRKRRGQRTDGRCEAPQTRGFWRRRNVGRLAGRCRGLRRRGSIRVSCHRCKQAGGWARGRHIFRFDGGDGVGGGSGGGGGGGGGPRRGTAGIQVPVHIVCQVSGIADA